MVHRMTKPSENQIDTKELAQKFSELEAVVGALEKKLEKEIRHNANMDKLNTELRKIIENDVIDAFERIKNIELKFFPNLASDIVCLNDIIGEGDGKAWNPLDHRKP
jgi:regulator of replication initiation timing